MTEMPASPKIYHITHVGNLARIIQAGGLWSDAQCIAQRLDCETVGMPNIKKRRLEELDVGCHPGTKVGEYVPFYFCPRSIMLFILHKGNHPDLAYKGGQQPMIHLQADLHATITWADANRIRWAFSDSNAGARTTRFYNNLKDLNKINWSAVFAADFRSSTISAGKQAEFLVHGSFPWTLVERIGVMDGQIAQRTRQGLGMAADQSLVSVERQWYY